MWELILVKVQDTKINILKYHICMPVMDFLEKKEKNNPFHNNYKYLGKRLNQEK